MQLGNESAYIIEFGPGNETRTRDPDLGKVVLYQLSYSRISSEEGELYVAPS